MCSVPEAPVKHNISNMPIRFDTGGRLLREHLLNFFVAQADFVDRVSFAFERFKIAFDV